MTEKPNRKIGPVDISVGDRVRTRRMIIGMSQEKLGEKMNITFQQIQKYEKGTNRIGAGRLFELARILDVPVGYFFDEKNTDARTMESLASKEAIDVAKKFDALKDGNARKAVKNLIRDLSITDQAAA
jgi:transcriptional regulator with XRE-family HTH domain